MATREYCRLGSGPGGWGGGGGGGGGYSYQCRWGCERKLTRFCNLFWCSSEAKISATYYINRNWIAYTYMCHNNATRYVRLTHNFLVFALIDSNCGASFLHKESESERIK